jgi:hypothetical protein
MKIKIKGVCVDINKPRSKEALTRLLTICQIEVETAAQPRKSFINMLIPMIKTKLKKEYNLINNQHEKEETQFA